MRTVPTSIAVAAVALAACSGDDTETPGPTTRAGAVTGGGTATGSGSNSNVVPVADPPGSRTNLHNGFLALGDTSVYFAYQGQPTGGVDKVAKQACLDG